MNAMEHMDRIMAHYEHACEKHPDFCPSGNIMLYREPDRIKSLLDQQRSCNDEGFQVADCILAKELLEMELAISQGDMKQAIYEAYDTIAVLMRMAEMMEALDNAN